jgi:glycosyltransferase involved in cell wall biosynthesis
MKIGISLLTAGKNKVGPDRVSFNLINNLIKFDRKNEYVIFVNKASSKWFSKFPDNFKIVNVNLTFTRLGWFWEHIFFIFDKHRRDIDLLHFPQSYGVIGYKGKFVLTIHDLRAYLRPDLVNYRSHLVSKIIQRRNMQKAIMIITVSNYVKNEIIKNCSINPNKIFVIYNGVDERFYKPINQVKLMNKYNLPKDYVLFVGETHPNKNLRRTIEAFRYVQEKYKLNLHFIIAGSPGADHDKLKSQVKHLGFDNFVHFLGYFPDKDLPFLYRNARIFIFPSIDEGFGIPPIEAMASGIPVVASNVSSIPEILGDAAILVNPFCISSIAKGIEDALINSQEQQERIKKAIKRLKLFSWEKMTKQVIEVYRSSIAF